MDADDRAEEAAVLSAGDAAPPDAVETGPSDAPSAEDPTAAASSEFAAASGADLQRKHSNLVTPSSAGSSYTVSDFTSRQTSPGGPWADSRPLGDLQPTEPLQGTAPGDTAGAASPTQQAPEAGAAAEGSPAATAADQATADAADEQLGPAEPAASVTFTVPAERWSHTQDVPLNTTAIDIRRSLCGKWGIGEDALSVRFAGQAMPDMQSLLDCRIQEGGECELELVIHHELLQPQAPEQPQAPQQPKALPGDMEVQVQQAPGMAVRMVTVTLDATQVATKRFLGGYRDKRNGTVYHHADCQTEHRKVEGPCMERLCRQTQTVDTQQRSAQTRREAAVQMARPDVLLDDSLDRVVAPRPYTSAERVWAVKVDKAIIIQRYARGWMARRRVARLVAVKYSRDSFEATQASEQSTAETKRRAFEVQRRMHPRTAADFALLNKELAAWVQSETQRIKMAGLSLDEQQAQLQELLHKETKLLQTIDQLRGQAHIVLQAERTGHKLQTMAQPKQWPVSNGQSVEVDTPFTTRARELMQLYRGLNLQGLSLEERLDVLLHVKWTVKEFDCALTREIVQLIDREADLLNRGRQAKTLEGLRKRISSLFLDFVEDPVFNPASRLTPSEDDYVYSFSNTSSIQGLNGHAAQTLFVS